jgi:hypothetical protein
LKVARNTLEQFGSGVLSATHQRAGMPGARLSITIQDSPFYPAVAHI